MALPVTPCPECRTAVGELHREGCDVERCVGCGGQRIACDCIYGWNGMDPALLEETAPEVFESGPTRDMEAVAELREGELGGRLAWSGEWPGTAECREYGWWCREIERGYEPCEAGAAGARADLTRLVTSCRWDAAARRFVR